MRASICFCEFGTYGWAGDIDDPSKHCDGVSYVFIAQMIQPGSQFTVGVALVFPHFSYRGLFGKQNLDVSSYTLSNMMKDTKANSGPTMRFLDWWWK